MKIWTSLKLGDNFSFNFAAVLSMAWLVIFSVNAAYAEVMQSRRHGFCADMSVHAHRGHPEFPENSLSAVRRAWSSGEYDAAEIDVQLLRDGVWVLHHDPITGRVVSGLGKARTAKLDSRQWKHATMLGHKGQPTGESAPFFSEVLNAAHEDGGKLNIEIKGKYSCTSIQALYKQVASSLSYESYFFTSMDKNALTCLRQTDSKLYLGLVVSPDFEGTKAKYSDKINWAKSIAERYGVNTKKVGEKAEQVAREIGNEKYLDSNGISQLSREIGKPFGMHMDVTSLKQHLSTMLEASAEGVSIYTYSRIGEEKHLQILREINSQYKWRPTGVIVDDAKILCGANEK